MSTAVLALGGNLGDRAANLQAGTDALRARGIEPSRLSSIWETEPVPADQPAYLNAVIVAATDLEPNELLDTLKEIEKGLGRRPGRRWGPRPLDIDILFYNELDLETEQLTIPHPRIAERPFVLAPLAEVVDGPLPVLGETAAALLAALPRSGLLERVRERLT